MGLPVALASAAGGFTVYGIDINSSLIENLRNGVSPIGDIASEELVNALRNGSYFPTVDTSQVANADIVVVCVPTPLNSFHQPDLTALEMSLRDIAPYIASEALVIIESTVSPGTIRGIALETLTIHAKVENFDVAFSPERIDPSNKQWTITNTPKIVSGLTPNALKRASDFYKTFISEVVEVPSVEIAETAKLLENTFRLVNISFVNELAQFCDTQGIDILEVIKAAATKPYGFMPFFPSAGVGGHCIPVDPVYLSSAARDANSPLAMVELATAINREVPARFVAKAASLLGGLSNKRILIIGIAYKPNVSDVRETPAASLIGELRKLGAEVSWHDELVKTWNGETSQSLSSNYDLVILVNVHKGTDLSKVGNTLILDTKGGFN